MYLHDLPEFADLLAIVGREHRIEPALVEKDYWIMHCLFGLQRARYAFELKGGTSLSKGYQLIHRFSEDIDIKIMPLTTCRSAKNRLMAAKFYSSLLRYLLPFAVERRANVRRHTRICKA